MTHPPLAIVVKGWPRLSETFIAQELVALEQLGVNFEVWSLRHPTDTRLHDLHRQMKAPVHYLPEYLYEEPERVRLGFQAAQAMPGYRRAQATFQADYARDTTPNRLRRWGQACVLARELPEEVLGLYAHFLHTPSSVARYAAILRGLPWSFSAHAKDIWTSPDWEIEEKLDPSRFGAAFGVTCTAYGAERLRSLSAAPERIRLVYHGLDLTRFPAPPARAPRAADGPLKILSIGRLVEKKGFDRLIEALALLPADLDWHWTHIGGGDLGDRLKAQAKAAGVSDRIDWLGALAQGDVVQALATSDLFVLPSRVATDGDRDGLPNVLMEAASQKLPIISTPVSAIPEFVQNGRHGLLVEDTGPALAQAIRDMAADPARAAAMAGAAYDRLVSDFAVMPGIRTLSGLLNGITRAGVVMARDPVGAA
ncbi:glycosyltransferase family 4 protein [Chachezhania sediminis]|uniref:glycosyltransferase family 4 protein n=1 Tax=Chachezhania sediminis TaxID=2599291 RepID=UPI00131C1D47|nr:glycosyltransferase family 4 protein [Chachezhania sediminis]